MSARPFVSFVVPCYNEEDNVALTVNSIHKALPRRTDLEIILVDDCSQDRTLECMHALAEYDPCVRVVHNSVNLSLGGSYKRGVAIAQGAFVIMVPGDDGFPSESISEILQHAGEADIIIPSVENTGSRTLFRAFASRCFTTLLNWIFWLDIGYYNGAVLHRTDLLQQIEITTNGFAYQAEALIKLIARGATYAQCKVRIQERAAGKSTALSRKNQVSVLKTIIHLMAEVGVFRRIRLGRSRRGKYRN